MLTYLLVTWVTAFHLPPLEYLGQSVEDRGSNM